MATFSKLNGRWRAQIRRRGVSKSKYFDSKAEAQVWARKEESAIDQGAGKAPAEVTLGQLIDEYLVIAPGRGRSKRQALGHLRDLIGGVKLQDADHKTFLNLQDRRSKEGAGPVTIAMDLTYIGSVLRHAGMVKGVHERAAAVLAMLSSVRYSMRHMGRIAQSDERDRRPTDAELSELFFYWEQHPPRQIPMREIVLFAIGTAMRLGEICSLRWEDLDISNNTILIRNRKHPDQRMKARNSQRVPLLRGPAVVNGQTVDPMAIIQQQPTRNFVKIFPYKNGSISTAFTRAVERSGIEDLHFHDLRHDGVSRLFEAGYAIEQVALVSGHKSWENLRRYTNLKPESLHKNDLEETV